MSSRSNDTTSSSSSSEEEEEEEAEEEKSEEDEDEDGDTDEEDEGQAQQNPSQTHPTTRTYQLALTLPSTSPFSTRANLHLTLHSHALVLFLAGGPGSAATSISLPDLNPQTAAASNPSINDEPTFQQLGNNDDSASAAATSGASLQSFVYAMPRPQIDGKKQQPISTPLYGHPLTVDVATRVARALVGRCGKPCYVGVSGEVAGMEMSGMGNEGLEVVRRVVEVVGKVAAR